MHASSSPFTPGNPYDSRRVPVFARNAVSTSHPLAAQAGLRMLWAGGNAGDAANAAGAGMTIVEPVSNGLGSDGFCNLWGGKELDPKNQRLYSRPPVISYSDLFMKKDKFS